MCIILIILLIIFGIIMFILILCFEIIEIIVWCVTIAHFTKSTDFKKWNWYVLYFNQIEGKFEKERFVFPKPNELFPVV